ncbi:hypothetical protein AWB69_04941 [Caballeronia udeis]|uniref:Uncharacterized protein n=1 Tax=Caballeronia udeis TaxID=1232866 RepID=A0A158HYX8_9BURK|nr:hypothetical protein [Caballeronia udeis]SAL48950.1 hypothetical protein AWB69_04941 [Caballeronia udeis]
MSKTMPDPASQETARLVLKMDAAISAFRAGLWSGVQALDAAARIVTRVPPLSGSVSASGIRRTERRVPYRPNKVEIAMLTALADTYGAEMLTNSSLGYVLRLFARDGGVALGQRVLFGESASDQQLSMMLTAARVALTHVSMTFPDAFFEEANALIVGFRPRPPAGPTE